MSVPDLCRFCGAYWSPCGCPDSSAAIQDRRRREHFDMLMRQPGAQLPDKLTDPCANPLCAACGDARDTSVLEPAGGAVS